MTQLHDTQQPSFAFFRLPCSDTYIAVVQRSGLPERLSDLPSLNGRRGFVVAPFAAGGRCPLLLIRPDEVVTVPVSACGDSAHGLLYGLVSALHLGRCPYPAVPDTDARAEYARSFASCHSRLMSGEFGKIVLSRRSVEPLAAGDSIGRMFLRACDMYPRMFVVLVYTPACGAWLAATPEVLLEGDGAEWRTMALAGTMKMRYPASAVRWGEKDRLEQRYVAEYISAALDTLGVDAAESGPYTALAGGLVHLRSDFTFGMPGGTGPGDVVAALHPTPAVCGLPLEATRQFIMAAEPHDREYYSGFTGPLGIGGVTGLYVSLRCMRLFAGSCALYAGGGLLRESSELKEWTETEAKMKTMRRIIGR